MDAGQAIERLGILGGTFDPIHIGHLVAASEALSAFQLDRVMFVPAGQPWQKTTHAPAEDRFMLTMKTMRMGTTITDAAAICREGLTASCWLSSARPTERV